MESLRIDKYLWAVRVYKTRSQATDACKNGKIIIEGQPVKPSRIIKPGEIILVKKPPVVYTYKVIGLLDKRQSAKIAEQYVENLTPEEEIQKNTNKRKFVTFENREPGSGRPTKRDRRNIDKLKNR
ncbi:MAG: RNA-binding S4 domain-containing protein [bacterium]